LPTSRRGGCGKPGRFARAAVSLALLLAAAPLAAGRVPIRFYDLTEGLASDKVWDLATDERGAIWIATTNGVSRFDGVEFRSWDTRHGLPHANVVRIARLDDGRILAGTSAGLALLDPGVAAEPPWRVARTDVERAGGQFVALAIDPRQTVWAGSNRGLFRLAGERGAERLDPEAPPTGEVGVRALAVDREGALVALFEGGLFRFGPAGRWSRLPGLPRALDDAVGVGGIAFDPSGRLWAASRSAVCVLPKEALAEGAAIAAAAPENAPPERLADPAVLDRGVCVRVEDGLPPSRQQRLLRSTPAGTIVIAGTSAAFEVRPDGVHPLVSEDELGDATILSVIESTPDAFWIGTNERGLARRTRAGLEIEAGRGELGSRVSTLLARGDEVVAIAGMLEPTRRLVRFAGGRAVPGTPAGFDRLEPSWGWGGIAELARDGALWLGVAGDLVRFGRDAAGGFAPGVPLSRRGLRALAGREPMRLLESSDGALWVSSYRPVELARIELANGAPGAVTTFPEIAGFARGAASALAEDGEGALWLGFAQGGIARRGAGESAFRAVDDPQGAPQGFVYGLAVESPRRVWAATGDGLFRCETDGAVRCAREIRAGALATLQTFALVWTRGRVAVASTRGVFFYDPANGAVEVFNRASGLPDNNVIELVAGGDGTIWTGSDRGVARIDPTRRDPAAAEVRFVGLAVAGRERPLPPDGVVALEPLVVGPHERLVEVEIAAVDPEAAVPPTYQWRLGDSDWTAPSPERRLRLAGLGVGATEVAARAVSAGGVPSTNTLALHLRVLPPFYRRAWFLAALVVLAIAGAVVAYRARIARLVGLERVRTRIAADLHDDLGSSLSRISILAEVATRQSDDRPEAQATLATIGSSARELAEMASDIVWAIDPQKDDLASWVSRLRRFGDDLFSPAGVRFEVAAPADAAAIRLAAAARRDLFLLAKEALNNAAKYAGARAVRVAVVRRGGRLEIAIDDDGRGFTAESRSEAERRGGGRGLRTMEERAGRLGGALVVAGRPGGGTRVALSFPL
jgi:signal transduction histidine kinase/ligand-binding sensor domain-containing protein